jgi:hypothetical protein
MMKLDDIPHASIELSEALEDETYRQLALARRLEAAGHRTISIGRAILTIERSDSREELPPECQNAEVLKISIYSDPDVSGDETPVCLYVEGGRHGLASAHLQVVAPDGRQRIFKMEDRLVRDEF